MELDFESSPLFWERFHVEMTLPETSSSHLKIDAWKTVLSSAYLGKGGGEILRLRAGTVPMVENPHNAK